MTCESTEGPCFWWTLIGAIDATQHRIELWFELHKMVEILKRSPEFIVRNRIGLPRFGNHSQNKKKGNTYSYHIIIQHLIWCRLMPIWSFPGDISDSSLFVLELLKNVVVCSVATSVLESKEPASFYIYLYPGAFGLLIWGSSAGWSAKTYAPRAPSIKVVNKLR